MALTPEHFFRDIGRAMRGLDCRVESDCVVAEQGDRKLSIDLRPLPPRRLSGLLSMPRCEVSIFFHGYDEPERDAFLEQFDQAFRRGGG